MLDQQSIEFGTGDDGPYIRIFDENCVNITYKIRPSQVPVILHSLTNLIWHKYTLVPRD